MTTNHNHPRSTRRPLLMLLALLAFTLTTLLGPPAQTAPSPQVLALASSSSTPTLTGRMPSATRSPRTSPARIVHTGAAAFTRTPATLTCQVLGTSPPSVRPTPAGSAASATSSSASLSTTALTSGQAARLALRTIPGLVNITTQLPDGSGEAGTGIVLRSSGLVLTAGHVVAGAVTLHADDLGDGQTYTATVIGIDDRHDVALIQLDNATGLPTARLSSTAPRRGAVVESVGNAYGRGYPSLGTGHVTAVGQSIVNPALPGHRISGLIAADNSIVPGQSGGPMIDRRGEVVGMNDAYQYGPDGTPTGAGFAVPISTALHAAHALLLNSQHATQFDTRA